MISLYSESLFLIDHEGKQVSFDLDAWRQELNDAFEASGIHGECWRTENLVLCLEEKARLDAKNNTCLTEEQIIRLLVSMLNGTGYGEVAAAFLEQHQQKPPLPEGKFQTWTESDATLLLLRRLPLAQAAAKDLARLCLENLSNCGLSECSEDFLQELAVLLLHARNDAVQTTETPTATAAPTPQGASGIQYISPQIWQEKISERPEFAETLQDDSFRLLPLSDIFPAARLEFRLDRFCRNHLDGWAEELPLLTAMPHYLETANSLLLTMQEIITAQWPRLTNPARHLIFPNFHKFFQRRKKAETRLAEAIGQQMSRFPDIIVSFN